MAEVAASPPFPRWGRRRAIDGTGGGQNYTWRTREKQGDPRCCWRWDGRPAPSRREGGQGQGSREEGWLCSSRRKGLLRKVSGSSSDFSPKACDRFGWGLSQKGGGEGRLEASTRFSSLSFFSTTSSAPFPHTDTHSTNMSTAVAIAKTSKMAVAMTCFAVSPRFCPSPLAPLAAAAACLRIDQSC